VVEDEGGDVAGVGIAIADEAAALGRLVDSGFENPEVFLGAAEWKYRLSHNPSTMVFRGETQQISVGDIAQIRGSTVGLA
jgi:hypothetical protein